MSTSLKSSAQKLLDSTKIIQTLSNFGEVHIVGSFAFDLMTEPDIDIVVITNDPKASSESAVANISKMHLFQKIEYGDFHKFPRENRPPFYIFNMKTPWEDDVFEIEAWFVPDAKDKINFVKMMNTITPEQRQQILDLKLERKNMGIDKKTMSSMDIYKKILGLN